MRKFGEIGGRATGRWFEDTGHRYFDRLVASSIRTRKFRAIVGYESSSERAFDTAKKLGVTTILDAASLHYQTQLRFQSDPAPSEALRRKEAEIRLADAVLVPSTLARESYERAGVPAGKLHVVPLGVSLEEFRPTTADANARPFCFAFAGNVTRTKGVDLLLQGFAAVQGTRGVQLKIFGTGELQQSVVGPDIVWMGRVAHHVVARELPLADCLVLPSRFDSYGFAVVEALACGVPVIVSDMVGAKDLVVHGRNGWIFPSGDAHALASMMRTCLDTAGQRERWRDAARSSALTASWQLYHSRLADTVAHILDQQR